MLRLTQFAEIVTVYDIFNSTESTLTTKRNKLAAYLTPPRAHKIARKQSLILSDMTTVTPMGVSFYKESPSINTSKNILPSLKASLVLQSLLLPETPSRTQQYLTLHKTLSTFTYKTLLKQLTTPTSSILSLILSKPPSYIENVLKNILLTF